MRCIQEWQAWCAIEVPLGSPNTVGDTCLTPGIRLKTELQISCDLLVTFPSISPSFHFWDAETLLSFAASTFTKYFYTGLYKMQKCTYVWNLKNSDSEEELIPIFLCLGFKFPTSDSNTNNPQARLTEPHMTQLKTWSESVNSNVPSLVVHII